MIRPAKPSDRALLSELAQDLPADCHRLADWLEEPAVTTAIAEQDGAAAGFVMAALAKTRWVPSVPASSSPLFVEVLALVVRPEARRTGLGGELLQYALELGLANGARMALAVCAEDNAAIRHLLSRNGFETNAGPAGRYRDGREAVLLTKGC